MDASSLSNLRGKFVVLDGPDGSGKSTQRELLAEGLRGLDVPMTCCRDPGGTAIGDRIRSVLLDFDLSTMNVNCEALLFMASRAQLVAEVIRPALEAGHAVLCDRFVTSTCAYQGAAGYDPRRVVELARFAIDDCWPDVTVVLDVDVEQGFERIGRKKEHAGKNRQKDAGQSLLIPGAKPDAMEARSLEYHRKVRQMFLEVGSYYPRPVVVVDGRSHGESDEIRKQRVHERVVEAIRGVLG
ncbi:MAG: dTMP kinase [Phycisphaerae bacterium]|nr:dTMP kinase [Phycisphaerae bacterium]